MRRDGRIFFFPTPGNLRKFSGHIRVKKKNTENNMSYPKSFTCNVGQSFYNGTSFDKEKGF